METPSEDDTTGTATYYYHVGGVRVINDPNPQPYSSTSGGTNYFYASGNWGGSAPTGAFTVNGSTHIMTFSGYYSTYTYSSSTIEAEFFFANDDEVIFLGWWVYGWNDNGSDGGEDWSNIISDDLRFSTTLSGSYSSNLSSEGTIYYGLFYYGNETVTTSVYLDANGGTCNPNSIEVVPGRTYGYLPTPYRAGYTFEGWYYGDELVTSTSKTVNTLFNYSLVAHWTANTYYNYYRYRNSSGTATTGTAQTRTYGQSFTTRSSTYYSYYTSNGWSLYGWAK